MHIFATLWISIHVALYEARTSHPWADYALCIHVYRDELVMWEWSLYYHPNIMYITLSSLHPFMMYACYDIKEYMYMYTPEQVLCRSIIR